MILHPARWYHAPATAFRSPCLPQTSTCAVDLPAGRTHGPSCGSTTQRGSRSVHPRTAKYTTPPAFSWGSAHPTSVLSGSVASYLMHADVRLHILMTHRNHDRPRSSQQPRKQGKKRGSIATAVSSGSSGYSPKRSSSTMKTLKCTLQQIYGWKLGIGLSGSWWAVRVQTPS